MQIRPYVWYPRAVVDDWIKHRSEEMAAIQLRGYYLQVEPENKRFRFVRKTDTRLSEGGRQKTYVLENAFIVEPIKKRRPQQRVDSLMLGLIDESKKTGLAPLLTDPRVAEVVSQAARDGRTGVTAEEVRRIAQLFLDRAEKERNERESHMVTRPSIK